MDMTTEGWQLHQLAQEYPWKALKNLLSSDPELKILNPKLIGEIKGTASLPKAATNPLEGISAIIQLLQDAGDVAVMFDADKRLECDRDQVMHACQSLYNKLVPLTGKRKSTDQAVAKAADAPRGYHT
uniref:Uncharacterized protein n=1 Tax=Peronospora matthiolae TaxID=2874970 RepID=A0AAV1USV6_9STRA